MSRVALIGENSIEYIDKLIDIWNNGDCAVLIDWRTPFQTIVSLMIEADVHKCYIEKKLYEKASITSDENILFTTFERRNISAEYLSESIYDKFKPNYSKNEAIVLYSSGTTGKSKGIILSHFAINTNADAIIDYMKPTAIDCIYIAKTLSHSSTLTGELLVALKTKTKLVISPTIVTPRYILSNICKFNVSIICLNPILLSMLSDELLRANYNISSLRTIYASGSILNDKLYEKAHEAFKNKPIYNVYGLSEAGPRVTAQRDKCCLSNSVGKSIHGIDIAVVDERGEPVSYCMYGIIHVNTPSKFAGYVSGDVKQLSLYKEWLNTGDIGYIDKNGELHIVGRADDVIILDSRKIYPNDIEKQILKSTPVLDCVVLKIEYNDSEFLGCLYTGNKLKEQEIRDKLKKKLPSYEIPRRFIWCDSIPRTLNGKISDFDAKLRLLINANNAKEMKQE